MSFLTGSNPIPPRDRKPIRVGFWTILLIFVAIGISIGLSALDDDKGNPLFDNGTLTSTISAAALIGAAVGPILLQQYRDNQVIKHEVKNDHKTNMRVEQDQRHYVNSNQNMTILDEVRKGQELTIQQGRKVDALDRKFDSKVDELRREFQAVQHENVTRLLRLESKKRRRTARSQ